MKQTRISSLRFFRMGVLLTSILLLASCKQDVMSPTTNSDPGISPIPRSPGTIIVPADNPMTAAKIDLGRHLFFDKALSVDGTTACATCHDPSIGFADMRGLPTSMGFEGRMGTRNAPSLANIVYNTIFTWDGRFKSLEAHAAGPIFNQLEMGNNFSTNVKDTTPSDYNSGPGPNDTLFLFKRLNGHKPDASGKSYPDLYQAAWNTKTITIDGLTKAIATFERTFISTQSTFDRYNNGDQTAYQYNPQALQGFKLFIGKANCVSCHSGYNFTDQQFHNNGIGISLNPRSVDSGRVSITKNTADLYKFKTPSLRNVALSGPYMHDGSFSTLEDVIRSNYNLGGRDKSIANKDEKIKPLALTQEEITDLVEFLKTLSDPRFTTEASFVTPWK